MASKQTVLELAEAFIVLTGEKPPSKISVSDIISAAGKNRKTFYYHFVDKNQLIEWIFRYDFARELKKRLPSSQLVYERDYDAPYSDLPYYATTDRKSVV